MQPLEAFLEGSIRTATPLALAALGEVVVQRAGLINIGLEGAILAGAFGALVGADVAGLGGGMLASAIVGMAVAAIFALFTVRLRADQIVTGTAINLFALGATGALYRGMYGAGSSSVSLPTMTEVRVPVLGDIPWIGTALFQQPLPTYGLMLIAPLVWWWMYRTHTGLALRACGEAPEAAESAGVRVARVRTAAILFGGMLGGLAGGTLVLAQAGSFAEGMSAGRGFIAIAIVVLGRWHPLGMLAAAVVFGAASAAQYFLQSSDSQLPYQFFLALPYVLTLIALSGVGRRVASPAALGRS